MKGEISMFSKSKAVVCVALSAAMLLGLTEIEGTGASAATAATGSAIVTTGSAVTTLEPVVSPEPTPVVDTSKIKLSKKTMNLMAGKKITLKVTGTTSTVTWTSSDESIATVSDKGVVKGIKKGSTEVQASVDGIKLTCKVSVVAKMSKKDFDRFGITEARYVRGKRKVTVRKINFIYLCQKKGYAGKGGFYYTFQFKNGTGKRRYTNRGIKTGSKLPTIKKKYGDQIVVKKCSKKDAFSNMKLVKKNKAKKYTEVSYSKYKIRFFLNSKSKVVGIIVACNMKNIKKKHLKADGYL